MMGAACACVPPQAKAALQAYGAAVGLAFQVVDDILDVIADSATLGKTAGKDAASDKPTYVSLLGLAPAQAYASELLAAAHAALADSGLPDVRPRRPWPTWWCADRTDRATLRPAVHIALNMYSISPWRL